MSLTDFHTHILPKMDDGSDGTETSLRMLEALEAQGVTDVVLTPHYYSQREPIEKFLARRQASYERLCSVYQGPVRFHLGAEVYYSDYLFNNDDLSSLCIEGTDILLLELPYNIKLEERHIDQICRLSSEYLLTPMLAHVERYPSIVKSAKNIRKLLKVGCLLQVNASSFEVFGKRRLASLVKNGVIDAIGTDCHNLESRPPVLKSGLDKLSGLTSDEDIARLSDTMQRLLK